MKVYVGSKHYISPEMIQRSRYSKDIQHYSKTDIWSIGTNKIKKE
jgi:serine/threonine protein kinase